MRSQKLNTDQPVEAIDAAEARMRLALGLSGTARPASSAHGVASNSAPPSGTSSHDTPRARRRFAQDGDVPVVMLGRSRDSEVIGESRVATLTAELRDERNSRTKAERALDEANLAIQSLKTKLAHTEMAFEEKLRGEQEGRAQIEALRLQEQEARKRAEKKEAESALALSLLERRVEELEAELASAKRAVSPAAPKSDLFDDLEPVEPVRKTRAGRPPSVAKAKAPEAEAEADVTPVKARKTAATRAVKKTSEIVPAKADEDQPIEWWLPSFRAKRHTSAGRSPVAPVKRKAR
jgi:hypothetical protein